MTSNAIRERRRTVRYLLATNRDIDEGLCSLLRLSRETVVRLGKTESVLARCLENDSLLVERVERSRTIAPRFIRSIFFRFKPSNWLSACAAMGSE